MKNVFNSLFSNLEETQRDGQTDGRRDREVDTNAKNKTPTLFYLGVLWIVQFIHVFIVYTAVCVNGAHQAFCIMRNPCLLGVKVTGVLHWTFSSI